MKSKTWMTALLGAVLTAGAVRAADLEQDFTRPPESTRPRCYWYWIDGHISREGITHDLEAMKRVGIGEGYIGIIGGGDVKALTDPWWELLEHAVREGGRLGVDIGLFNCPGWSQSGGPWVKPEQSMRHLVWSETRVRGGQRFEGRLPAAEGAIQDVAVLAFPAPAGDDDTIDKHARRITRDAVRGWTFEAAAPFTARSLTVVPAGKMHVACDLEASDDGKAFRPVRHFWIDRHNIGINVGPVPLAPVAVSFPAVTAKFFRLTFSAKCELTEVRLSAAARVESCSEKQLAKMFQDPQPPFDYYRWATPAEPDSAALVVPADKVVDLSRKMAVDGTLKWDAPAGEWIVQRVGARPTGVKNAPAPEEATGLEVDKMSRPALKTHFEAYIGKLLARIPEKERTAWKHVVADSYEMGPQNWTDDLVADFRDRYGYDPLRFLPALSGRIVGSADQSDRFLWDLRRMVADRVARDYVGGLRDLCHKNGLKMWLENYGHWGFPGEFLKYGGSCDEISGEFWADGNLGSIELRDASSAAHTYGMPAVFAEAFTGGPAFRNTPRELKARGDWAYCEGVNQFVLHVYIHQPWDEKRPGVNAWFGTEFNRQNTWFEHAKPWIDYQRRCTVMLQAGRHVADVAYFIGEDAPKMAGVCNPALPSGYDYDYINADVIENRMQAKGGRLVLPDGMSYRMLVLPDQTTMRPAVLRKLRELVADGGAVLGPAPTSSPSLQDYPACDAQVRKLAGELWGGGRMLQGADLGAALGKLATPPDVVCADGILWTHRRDAGADIYFLSNQKPAFRTETVSFRTEGRAPEFWWPETGAIERPAVYDTGAGTTRVPVPLGPSASVFVVFRAPASASRVVELTRDGRPVVDLAPGRPSVPAGSNTFTVAVWARPGADTTLLPEAVSGIHGMAEARNDAFAAPHGGTFGPGDAHAGCGLAIGRNGVAVFEHGAGFFSPVLVQAAPLTNWTHVAVVFRDGEPTLYLDGVLARKGRRSAFIVHSGVTSGGNPGFVGALGEGRTLAAALGPEEVRALMERMPKPADDGPAEPPIALTLGADGRIAARVERVGRYAWKNAAGAAGAALDVASLPAAVEIAGPWEVAFDPRNGGLEKPVVFERLDDWSQRPEEGIKYYSGTATYRKTIQGGAATGGGRLWLELGDVQAMAAVRVNGQDAGALWKPPYRVDVTALWKPGANTLEIDVINTWHNRLVGDLQPGVAKRWTSVTKDAAKAKDPLMRAGLLGPVVLRTVSVVTP